MKYYFVSYFHNIGYGMAPFYPLNVLTKLHPLQWLKNRGDSDKIAIISWQEVDEETYNLYK